MRPLALLAASLCVAASAAVVPAQRGAAIAEALRRSDPATAEALAAAEPDGARRALYEAALQPFRLRVGAFLSVAQRFPAHDVAGEALLAGCAAALVLQGRWPDDVAPLPDLLEALGEPWWDRRDQDVADGLAAVLPALLHAVRKWEGERPRAAELPLLQRLAKLCACQVVRAEPLPIERGEPWPLPRPLGEDLLVSVRPLGDEVPTPLDLVDALAREGSRRWLLTAKDTPAELPSPGAGRWLLEVQSLAQPWRALRVVDVGSLGAAVLADQGVLVLGAWDGIWAHDEAITWSAWRGQERLAQAARGGVGVWRLDDLAGAFTVQVRRGDERARVPVWVPRDEPRPQDLAVAHWQCDRPLHRAGEVVQGRVVVRTVAWTGTGLAAVPTTAAAAPGALSLVCTWPDGSRTQHVVTVDAHGLAPFEVPIPLTASPGRVHAQLGPLPGGATLEHPLTEIAAFVRPAVVGTLDGPQRVAAADGTVTLRLQVAWASGGPAPAVPVDVAVEAVGSWRPERRRLATGADGVLVLPIDVRERGGQRLECRCALHGPDGQVETLAHTFTVDAAPIQQPVDESAAPSPALAVAVRGDAVVGQPVTLELRGAAYADLLVVIGRGAGARVVPAAVARDGLGTHVVTVLASDWPRLDVTVVAPAGTRLAHTTTPVRLAPARALQLVVPAEAKPKQAVRCRATTSPGSVVTFAVVDDRVFRLGEDPTRTPDEALRPFVRWPQWSLARSREAADPQLVFGGLLVDGRVPGPGELHEGNPGGGGAAGPSGPAPGGSALRCDFRATACFRSVVADGNGVAELAFELPDDVTTWRVTACSVDALGEGGLATATFATRLPLVAEPQLPRVLRVGDRVEVPLVLDRAATTTGDEAVRYTVAADGAAQRDGQGDGRRMVARGQAEVVSFSLRATQVGEAVVRCEAGLGAHGDRSERHVPVLPDAVEATVAAAAAGRGRITIDAPAGGRGPLRVHVFAGGAAAWRELAKRLQQYPYGCVEQTLSRLLPYAVGTVVGDEPSRRADRIGKGMARLRQLQRGNGAFAWWPAGAVDLAMTGLVLHGLAALRGGGIDAQAYGLRIDVEALLALARGDGSALSSERIELLAGLWRFAPDHRDLSTAAAALVDAGTPMPRGAALRLGLAFAAAGDRERAVRCRRGLPSATDQQAGFPGDDPLVLVAHQLELDRALGDPIDPVREMQLVQELLGSGCRTYTDAVTLVALGPSLAAGGKDVAVEVAVDGGAAMPLVLTAAGGLQATHRVEGGRQIVVRCADAQQLLFVSATTSAWRPGTGPAWATPIVVERTLSGPGVVTTADGAPTLRVGEPVRVTLRVQSPVAVRYVALVCPLPAGCEVLGESPELQRFDDRVVVAWPSLAANEARTCTFDFVATLPGTVAWPPVLAEPMYESACSGGSAGGRLVVVPRVVPPPAAAVRAFLVPAAGHAVPTGTSAALPTAGPAETLADRLAAAAATIDTIWSTEVMIGAIYGFEDEPDGEQRAALDAALALLERHAADEGRAVLQQLEAPALQPGRQRGAALAPWRRELLGRLWLLQERCLDAAVAYCRQHFAGEADVDALVRAVRSLPPARAEAVALQALTALWPGDAEAAAALVAALPHELRDERLLGLLTAMLGSGVAELVDDVLERLPTDRLERLAPSVLVGVLAATDGEAQAVVVRALCRSAAGQRALRSHLTSADDTFDARPELWPEAACRDLPASAWAVLAAGDEARARARLASSDVPTATVWRWLLARGDGVPLTVLLGALRDRRAVPSAEVRAAVVVDPTVALLRDTFVAEQEPGLAAAVFAAARPFVAGGRDVEVALAECVGDLVAAHGDVATVRAFAPWLSATGWRLVWRRCDASAAGELLRHEERLGYGLPGDDERLVALLQRAVEWRDADDAVAAIGAEPAGLARLLAVRARLAPDVRGAIDAAMADELGFDVARGGATPDAATCVVEFAARHGWGVAWPASLAGAASRLLTLRGIR